MLKTDRKYPLSPSQRDGRRGAAFNLPFAASLSLSLSLSLYLYIYIYIHTYIMFTISYDIRYTYIYIYISDKRACKDIADANFNVETKHPNGSAPAKRVLSPTGA